MSDFFKLFFRFSIFQTILGTSVFFFRVRPGVSFRQPQADTCSADRRPKALFKTWPKPKTAHEKPLAPRVFPNSRY